jgi:hypothetical protein
VQPVIIRQITGNIIEKSVFILSSIELRMELLPLIEKLFIKKVLHIKIYQHANFQYLKFMLVNKKSHLLLGDLVKHKMPAQYLGEKIGLLVGINPILGSGFQSAEILWCDSGETEIVMINYLESLQHV